MPEGLNPVLSPVWGASSPEGQRFPSPRMALRGGRGTRGFRRGWGRAPRGRGRGPPVLPRKHELIDKGKGNVSPPTKSRSKKRLFGPAYASPPPLKRPRRTHPIKEPSPDAARTVFDRLSPPGVVPPVGVMGAYGGEAREGSPFREDGSGDEAFVRELPMDAARTPLAKGEEGVGRRGFPPRNDKRERDVARMTIEEGGPLDVANWSPVHSSQGNMSPGHPSHSNWSPIHSSKDGWSSDLSPGHSIESKWSLKGTDLPNRNVQSPGHQSRTEEALEVTDNELLQSPDHPGTPGLSRGHLEGVKEPAVPSGRTVVEKMSKRNPHIYSPLDKENNPGLLDKETNRGPLDKEANKPLCKGLHNIDECADRKEVSCHSSGSVVEEHAIGGNVASTSGLGTRPRCGPSGDGGAGEEVPAHRDAQNAVKASIIKVSVVWFCMQVCVCVCVCVCMWCGSVCRCWCVCVCVWCGSVCRCVCVCVYGVVLYAGVCVCGVVLHAGVGVCVCVVWFCMQVCVCVVWFCMQVCVCGVWFCMQVLVCVCVCVWCGSVCRCVCVCVCVCMVWFCVCVCVYGVVLCVCVCVWCGSVCVCVCMVWFCVCVCVCVWCGSVCVCVVYGVVLYAGVCVCGVVLHAGVCVCVVWFCMQVLVCVCMSMLCAFVVLYAGVCVCVCV